MLHPAIRIQEALKATPLLTKFQLYEAADMSNTQDNDAVFKFLISNGTLLKIGEKRGTRYYLATQNLSELLEKEAQDAAEKAEEPEEEVVRKPKLSEDEVEERVGDAVKAIKAFGKEKSLFSFDELTSGVEDFPAHILRRALRDLLDEDKLFETMNKRGKRYSFNESEIDKAEDGGRQVEVDKICHDILPFIKKKERGITTSMILEEFPEIRKHVLYLALNQLEEREQIERYGQGKSTSFSTKGMGEVEKIGSYTSDKVNEVKDRAREMVTNMRVVRPLILESKMDVDRRLLDTALDLLVEEGEFRYSGERRAKVIAVLDADEEEIANAREEQPSRSSEVCDGLSGIICNGMAFASTQRDGIKIVSRKSLDYDPMSKTILHESTDYGDFVAFMKELLRATDEDLDADARNGRINSGRSRK